jgi:DNA (cytosine-5)-methyltransferase 1
MNFSKEEIINFLSEYNLSYDGKKPMEMKQLKRLNYDTLSRIYKSIIRNNNLVDIERVSGSDIPDDTDILTYSFPCQDLSNVGFFHGYIHGINRNKKTRSGLLWQVERILDEKSRLNKMLPRYLLLENLPSLLSNRHKDHFQEWVDKLKSLGYYNKIYKLNSLDFGVPQNRNRVIMISIRVDADEKLEDKIEKYFENNDLKNTKIIKKFDFYKQKSLDEILKTDYSNEKYFREAEKSQPNNTPSRIKIWEQNYKIINDKMDRLKKVQTITTKQDRHPNSGNIYFNYNVDKNKAKFRFLTPRECMILMGFDEEDYEKLVNNNFKINSRYQFFSRDVIFKLSGNSIVVDVLQGVFYQIFDIDRKVFNNF